MNDERDFCGELLDVFASEASHEDIVNKAERRATQLVGAYERLRARAEKAEAALQRRTRERDRARHLAKQLVDMLDDNSRCEVIEGVSALLADEPEEVAR